MNMIVYLFCTTFHLFSIASEIKRDLSDNETFFHTKSKIKYDGYNLKLKKWLGLK